MFTHRLHQALLTAVAVGFLTFIPSKASPAAETNGAAEAAAAPASASNDVLRTQAALLDLQEQLRAVAGALEQTRRESEAAARRNDETLVNRLAAIEETLTRQLDREQSLLRESNRSLFLASVSFAGVGILVLVIAVWFQVRALNRIAMIADAHREMLSLALPQVSADSAGELPFPGRDAAASTGRRLTGAVGALQQRLRSMEQSVLPEPPRTVAQPAAGTSASDTRALIPPHRSGPGGSAPANGSGPGTQKPQRLASVLELGQSFLSAGQIEKAIECFDRAIAMDPANAEALMKKGTALQEQKKLMEALTYYDRAITANPSLALAYLYKGGVFNQLERFDEALGCYEQAQRLQELAGGVSPVAAKV